MFILFYSGEEHGIVWGFEDIYLGEGRDGLILWLFID